MINYNDIGIMLKEAMASSQRQGKHNIHTDGNTLVITSTKFAEPLVLPLDKSKHFLKSVELSRVLIRHICKLNGVKYNSSMQNVADKAFELLKSI